MNLVGEHQSAARFHLWASKAILRRKDVVLRAARKTESGLPFLNGDILHTRYTLEGDEATEEWQNFQLDGFGSWLWALAHHLEMSGETSLLEEAAESVALVVRYLSASWKLPNSDCWEEHPDELHPHTLAALYGGLRAAERLAAQYGLASAQVETGLPERLRSYVLDHGVLARHLVKSFSAPEEPGAMGRKCVDQVDASLLGFSTPYGLLTPEDPIMRRTVERIERDLHCRGGGVHRYLGDSYYGGGEWVLLAAWLGWYYTEAGERDNARELRHWVEAQADAEGRLPEQVSAHLLAAQHYDPWVRRWGPVAKPLLWSHAMYLILRHALESPTSL
jgi:GH15 family glucan-1,4-alpha-glucosidase